MGRESSPEKEPTEAEKSVERLWAIAKPEFARMGITGNISYRQDDDGNSVILMLKMTPEAEEKFLNRLVESKVFPESVKNLKTGESVTVERNAKGQWAATENKRRSKPKSDTPDLP
jgi:hypothetical protein